jgi:Ras-related protein Rab-1A
MNSREPNKSLAKDSSIINSIVHPSNEYDYIVKMHIMGNPKSGKSCLLLRYTDDIYTDSFISTGGYDFKIKDLNIGGETVKTQVFDNAPQGQFKNNTEHENLRGAHAIILVFDLTDENSFIDLKNDWLKRYNKIQRGAGANKVNIILVGTKSDANDQLKFNHSEIDVFISNPTNKIDAYIETSAKTGENVKAAFETAAKLVIDRMKLDNQYQTPRQILIEELTRYINRIKSHTEPNTKDKPDFSYGFLFFKNSRAINREVNFYLAQDLLSKLETTNDTIHTIFNDVNLQRNNIISKFDMDKRKDYKNRGIHSYELNNIINKAMTYDKSRKMSFRR